MVFLAFVLLFIYLYFYTFRLGFTTEATVSELSLSTSGTTERQDMLELILYEMRAMNHKMTSIEEWQHQHTQRDEHHNTTTAALSSALAEDAKLRWELEKAQLLAEVRFFFFIIIVVFSIMLSHLW